MTRIVMATTNPGKVDELTRMLRQRHLDIELLSLRDFPGLVEVEENGRTFEENACKKALGYAAQTGHMTLADDSGLIIDALNGEPGIHSARFAAPFPEGMDRKQIDKKNTDKVLTLLADTPDTERTARFACCLCLARPDHVLFESRGFLEGRITREPLGDRGFGYDPILWIPSLHKTAAQLDPAQKNAISHRGMAFEKLFAYLVTLS